MKHLWEIFVVLTVFLSPFILLYIVNCVIIYLLNNETLGNIAIFIIISSIIDWIIYDLVSFSYNKLKEDSLNLLIYVPVSFISLVITKKYLFPININLTTIFTLVLINSICVILANKLIEKYYKE